MALLLFVLYVTVYDTIRLESLAWTEKQTVWSA